MPFIGRLKPTTSRMSASAKYPFALRSCYSAVLSPLAARMCHTSTAASDFSTGPPSGPSSQCLLLSSLVMVSRLLVPRKS